MSHTHPTHFTLTVRRHNVVVHLQDAASREEAEAQKQHLEATMEGVDVEIVEVHERAESDLTTHTRELLENI